MQVGWVTDKVQVVEEMIEEAVLLKMLLFMYVIILI
jgi:hypothetical protein